MAELKKKADQPENPGDDDLEILHPERVVELRGERYTVHEYDFITGNRLLGQAEPLIADLHTLMESSTAITLPQVHGLLGRHAELVAELSAISIKQPLEFVAGLTQSEGYDLLMWWWSVNGPFYVRCAADRSLASRLVKPSVGAMSSPPSSGPDTAATETSAS